MDTPVNGSLHHVELWVPDFQRAVGSLGWLLEELGYVANQKWATGCSWLLGSTYVVVEQCSALTAERHDRLAPGLNTSRFMSRTVPKSSIWWRLVRNVVGGCCSRNGIRFAGGDGHYAAYLEDQDGFEVELVAMSIVPTG